MSRKKESTGGTVSSFLCERYFDFFSTGSGMVMNLRGALLYFQAISGLYINLEKSKMVRIGKGGDLDF